MANLSKKMNRELTWDDKIRIADSLLTNSALKFAPDDTTATIAKTMKDSLSDRMLSSIAAYELDDGKVIVKVMLNSYHYNNRTHTAVYSLNAIGFKGKHAVDLIKFDTKGNYGDHGMVVLDAMDDIIEAMADYAYSVYENLITTKIA